MNNRSLVAFVACVLVVVGVALIVRTPGADGPVVAGVESSSTEEVVGPAELLGRAIRDVVDDGVRTVEHKLDLSGTFSVRVIEAATKHPVAGAKVRGTFGLGWRDDRPTGLSFDQQVVSGADGLARFGQFPRQTSVVIHVAREGFRAARADARLGRLEGEKEIEIALTPGLSPEGSSVIVGLPPGITLPGASVLYADATTKLHDRVPVGGYVPIDDDPAATVVEHAVAIQLLLPGYAGPAQKRAFRRGTTLTLEPPGPAVSQEIVLLDELGRGVEGGQPRCWRDSMV